MSEQELDLPKGWVETTLQEICSVITDGVHKTPDYQESGIPFISIKNIRPFKFLPKAYVRYISEEAHDEMCKRCEPKFDDILLTKIGSLGYAKRVNWKSKFNIFVGLALLRPKKIALQSEFLEAILNSPQINRQCISGANGTGRMTLPLVNLRNMKFLLPPLNEQKRIVSKIEELFSKIDSTKQSLEQTKLQLELYRQSLLKSVFEGKLTENWRKKHHGRFLNIDDLIDLIKKANNEKNQEFSEIPREFLEQSYDLPNEWRWISLSNLGELNRGKSKHRPRNDPILFGGKYPFIQTGVVRNSNGRITSYTQTYNDVGLAQSRLFPVNTICITIAANIADTAILTFPSCFPDSIVGYNGFPNLIENMFILYYIQSVKNNLESIAPSTAQKNINLDILQKIAVPIMSNEEQKEIIARIEQGFSLIENTQNIVNSTLQTLQTMKMSVLKQAFEGKLVPQDPNDEPAQILLEKIKSTKEAQPTKKRRAKNVK